MISKDFSQKSEWSRIPNVDIVRRFNGEAYVQDGWEWNKSHYLITIYSINVNRYSRFGKITHLTMHKLDFCRAFYKGQYEAAINSLEPNYEEKVEIAEKLMDMENTVAIEVFPNQRNLVDEANVYHIWGIDKTKFPFDIEKAFTLPEDKEWEKENVEGINIEYMVRTTKTKLGKVAYFYLRRVDGKSLSWKEKQLLKNELQHESLTAIEIISEQGIDKTTCLIYLPIGTFLDFGLHLGD